MATKWTQPTAEDVKNYMSSVVTDRAAQTETQVESILSNVVLRIRGTIIAAGVTPVSQEGGEVPPEAMQHAVVLTVVMLLSATPNFGFLMRGETGSETGIAYANRKAEEWLAAVSTGKPVTYPKDVSEDEGRSLVRYGSESEAADLSSD
jgi:hypothetical protein